jgi:serine/threonine-protein kinase
MMGSREASGSVRRRVRYHRAVAAEARRSNETLSRVGTLLGGRYRLLKKLGEGGMGVVFEAEHVRLKQRFAVKLLGRDVATASFVARFEREARAAAQLESRHVARVFDVDTGEDGSPFFAMELLRGRDLHAEISLRGRLPWAEAARVVQEACVGMSEAHDRGIVHRDLKPANLFLHRQDGGRIVKVLDFGISKSDGETALALTQTQQALGTPLYMSPEQVRSPKHVDARTDVWSLGVILYEALTGQPPFLGETLTGIAVSITNDVPPDVHALCDDVPVELAAVVVRALAKRPEDRFATARELGASLAPFASTELGDVMPAAGGISVDAALESTVSADELANDAATSPPAERAAAKSRSSLIFALGIAGAVAIGLGALAIALRGEGAGRADGPAVAATTAAAEPLGAPNAPSGRASADPPASAGVTVSPSAAVSATAEPDPAGAEPTSSASAASSERRATRATSPKRSTPTGTSEATPKPPRAPTPPPFL